MGAAKAMSMEVKISDLMGQSKEEFWQMADRLVSEMLGRLIYAVVDFELEGFIGARWHERTAERRTTRAGKRFRCFTVLGRDLRLAIPRARVGGFRSQFLGFRKRRHEDFDKAVLNAYVAGTSMRETTALLYQIFGTSVSPGTISMLLREFDEERKAFQGRRLKDEYKYVVLDGMHVRCMVAPAREVKGGRGGETVERVVVLLARGIKEDGTRELIDFRVASGETEAAWESFFRSLFDRGLEGRETALFVHDGSDGIEGGLESVYGSEAVGQRCICHKLMNVVEAVKKKERREEVRGDASLVYQGKSVEEAWERLGKFRKKWIRRERKAVEVFWRDFGSTLRFFDVPLKHRRWITTTNPLERFIREMRRRTRPMGTFQGLASCERLMYVGIVKLSNGRRNRIPYSLWASQPRQRRGRGGAARGRRPDLDALRKELYVALNAWVWQ